MRITIYGTTDIAYLIASELHVRYNITIIDDMKTLPRRFDKLNINFLPITPHSPDFSSSEAIKEADIFISCLSLYEANVVACIIAKKSTKALTICYIDDPSNFDTFSFTKEDLTLRGLGIDHVLWPEEAIVQDIVRVISIPEVIDLEYFHNGKACFAEYRIRDDFKLLGKNLSEAPLPKSLIAACIIRDDKLFIPSGDTVFMDDDKVLFIGVVSSIEALSRKFFQKVDEKVNSAVIAGGGIVGYMLARRLERHNMRIRLIEKDPARADVLAGVVGKSEVYNADATDLDFFREEELDQADVFICATGSDEINLFLSVMARQAGIPKVISKVSARARAPLFEKAGADLALSPGQSLLNELEDKFLKHSGSIIAVVERGRGNIMELKVPERLDGMRLRDLELKNSALIALIDRKGKTIIPSGDTVIKQDDEAVIFTLEEYSEKIEKMFFK